MKQTVNEHTFHRAFEQLRPDQFTYQGLNALYDYLTDFEDGTGEEVELDVIGICCEYSEYDNLKEFQAEYSEEYKTIEDIEDAAETHPI